MIEVRVCLGSVHLAFLIEIRVSDLCIIYNTLIIFSYFESSKLNTARFVFLRYYTCMTIDLTKLVKTRNDPNHLPSYPCPYISRTAGPMMCYTKHHLSCLQVCSFYAAGTGLCVGVVYQY